MVWESNGSAARKKIGYGNLGPAGAIGVPVGVLPVGPKITQAVVQILEIIST